MGGNSTKATSGINGAGTVSQQDLGIQDSAKIFFEDTKRSAKELARDDLIRVLTGRSADAVNWLINRFGLDLSKVSRLGGQSRPRTHRTAAARSSRVWSSRTRRWSASRTSRSPRRSACRSRRRRASRS